MRRSWASIRDGRLVCAAWLAVALFATLNALVGYRRITWLFVSKAPSPPDPLARRIAAAVLVASRGVGGATCLTQACAARALLGLRGYAVTMRVGVRDAGQGHLAAHAWLISDDRVILGAGVEDFERYRPITDYR